MGIFDFFKKKKKVEEIVSEKLTFSEIKNWLEEKTKENQVKENEILVLIKDKINCFNVDLKEKIIVLNKFDVKSKKAEDKIKEVVSDSRAQYIETVNNLMSNLEDFKETKFPEITKRIDKIFINFNKASFKNYERATILIGKEMAAIKKTFKIFSKDLLEIFNNNKEISESYQKIKEIKLKLDLLDSVKQEIIKINKTIISLDKEVIQKEKENKEFLQEIKEIKQSDDYKNTLEKKEKINSLEKEFKEIISALKQLIDFKTLANFFHINKEQMKLLKNHKEDFYACFQKDNGKIIIELLNESKLKTEEISKKINLIKEKTNKISDYKKEIKKDEIQELDYKVKDIIVKINNLKIEKIKQEKRNENFRENKNELISSLKQEFNKINVELI